MEMPKARHAGDILGGGRATEAFSFDSEDITFRWDPDVPPHGGLRSSSPGGARIELRPTVATRPTVLGKQHRHSWSVVVNGVELYQNVWSDEQIPEPGLRIVVKAAIAASDGLVQRFARDEKAASARAAEATTRS
jgi:hypothetical protein